MRKKEKLPKPWLIGSGGILDGITTGDLEIDLMSG
jgi:hypothetical protein